MSILRVNNWSKYQHYKNRNPPWIKFHANTFQDYGIIKLSDPAKLLLFVCWTVASKTLDGSFPDDLWYLKHHGALGDLVTQQHIEELISSLFLIREQDASNALASCKQNGGTEKRRVETEKSREEQIGEGEKEHAQEVFCRIREIGFRDSRSVVAQSEYVERLTQHGDTPEAILERLARIYRWTQNGKYAPRLSEVIRRSDEPQEFWERKDEKGKRSDYIEPAPVKPTHRCGGCGTPIEADREFCSEGCKEARLRFDEVAASKARCASAESRA